MITCKLRKRTSDKHSQEIAALLGVSEAQLIHCRVGKDNVQRLVSKPIDILQDLTTIGKAIGITRNQYAVSIQTGAYNNPKFSNHGGLFLNPKALDLRMFFAQWSSVFALTEKCQRELATVFNFSINMVIRYTRSFPPTTLI